MTILPYGVWPSPVTPQSLAAGQVEVEEVRPDGPDTWWLEKRPQEGGRQALVRHTAATGDTVDVLPLPWNVRTRINEYGGGAYAVRHGVVVFSDADTNGVYLLDPGSHDPRPLTPQEPDMRYGGLVLGEDVVLAVREDHRDVGSPGGPDEPVCTLVALDLDAAGDDPGRVLVEGPDFILRPALSPDGTMLAWVEYDHPNMPWDTTRLRRGLLARDGTLTDMVTVADRAETSVVQPQFGPDGALWFASDESGWWNLFRDNGTGPQRLHNDAVDLVAPQWVLGMVDYAVIDADRAVVRWWDEAVAHLGILDATTGSLAPLPVSGVQFDHLHVVDDEVVARVGWPDRGLSPVRGRLGGDLDVLTPPPADALLPGFLSPAEPWSWTDDAGLTAFGLLHRPHHAEVTGPAGDAPPLLVMVHGGPTSRVEATLTRAVQFWTTRGFAVLQVNYSGSTGFGRDYRNRLRGQWGVLDIDDCVSGAVSVAEAGLADRARLAIRGGSAGGYAVLRALTTSVTFAAGTSLFGVADLAALAEHTHKLEARYLDLLVAPWPEGKDVYAARSPLHAVDRLHGELLLLQGSDDLVVPLAQATSMAAAMTDAGKDVELVVYEGEGHGFRKAETIIDAHERELAFYVHALHLGR